AEHAGARGVATVVLEGRDGHAADQQRGQCNREGVVLHRRLLVRRDRTPSFGPDSSTARLNRCWQHEQSVNTIAFAPCLLALRQPRRSHAQSPARPGDALAVAAELPEAVPAGRGPVRRQPVLPRSPPVRGRDPARHRHPAAGEPEGPRQAALNACSWSTPTPTSTMPASTRTARRWWRGRARPASPANWWPASTLRDGPAC